MVKTLIIGLPSRHLLQYVPPSCDIIVSGVFQVCPVRCTDQVGSGGPCLMYTTCGSLHLVITKARPDPRHRLNCCVCVCVGGGGILCCQRHTAKIATRAVNCTSYMLEMAIASSQIYIFVSHSDKTPMVYGVTKIQL